VQYDEHTSDLGHWQTVQQDSAPALRGFVRGYFASSSLLHAPLFERHLPSNEVPLLLNFGMAHRRLDEDGGWCSHEDAWIVGLHDRPQRTEAFGERHFMVVRFTPIGAHLFLGVPMHRIANQAIALQDIDDALAKRVMDRVGRAETWSERFTAMEAVIAERLRDAQAPRAVHYALRKIARERQVNLTALADEIDCSHRALIEQFRTCVGFPPKTVDRLLRFGRTVAMLNRAWPDRPQDFVGKPYVECDEAKALPFTGLRWADFAVDCGYFDQPHFIREFRQFAGATPGEFVRQVLALA